MEKYNIIQKITNEYLEGSLEKLTIQYERDNTMCLTVEYEDSHNFRYDYDMQYDLTTKIIKFLSHQSNTVLYRVSLDREEKFEDAICHAVFAS